MAGLVPQWRVFWHNMQLRPAVWVAHSPGSHTSSRDFHLERACCEVLYYTKLVGLSRRSKGGAVEQASAVDLRDLPIVPEPCKLVISERTDRSSKKTSRLRKRVREVSSVQGGLVARLPLSLWGAFSGCSTHPCSVRCSIVAAHRQCHREVIGHFEQRHAAALSRVVT